MFTEEELEWIRRVLRDYDSHKISPSYIYRKKMQYDRNRNKEKVRKELDSLRNKFFASTPEDLLKYRTQTERERSRIEDFSGIYIIYNIRRNKFYIGKAEGVYKRAYKHFIKGKGNPDVYEDYCSGEPLFTWLIPLNITSFSTLNELEDNAIRAYDSFHNGYNRVEGNIMDKYFFENDEYQKIADLILERIKDTDEFSNLTNNKKRMNYIWNLLREFNIPENAHFQSEFVIMIKEYQKAQKSKFD